MWKVDDSMLWYIKKNQVCSTKDAIKFPFSVSTGVTSSKMTTSELVVCDEDNPPDAYVAGPYSSTRVLCTLAFNLHPVPQRLWKQKSNSSGERYQLLDLTIGMQIESGGLRFDFRVDDVVYGKVTASFE